MTNFYSPDIIGVNHYITSERFLDENRKKYPKWSHAENTWDKYADVDVVRADIDKREGHYNILKSVHDRYNLSIALTEVHLGSSRDAQLRWFMEAYDACIKLKEEGTDIRGITSWSLLGAYDWNSLLTQDNNFYESGAFDVRSGVPRPTAVAHLIKSICEKKTPHHPVLQAEGWWKNSNHVHFAFGLAKHEKILPTIEKIFPEKSFSSTVKPILIVGATGTLGRAFAHICSMRNISYVLLSRKDMDILDKDRVELLLKKYEPWAVINAAGLVDIDRAERMPELCFRENAYGPVVLARACLKFDASFLTFSSDMVFDGNNIKPYFESNDVCPINIYGNSKVFAEMNVLAQNPSALVVRTSACFGPWDEFNFLAKMRNMLESEKIFRVANDQVITPTYIPDLVSNCLDLIIDRAAGIWHITNSSTTTWSDFAVKVAKLTGLDAGLIQPISSINLALKAKRPYYSALASENGIKLPSLEDAVIRYLAEHCCKTADQREFSNESAVNV